jgi:hypothetical protein
VKYLPEFGWNPLVMTLAPTNWSATSRSVDRGTFHVKEWPHPLKAYYSFQEQRAKRQGRAEQFAMKMSTPHAIAVGSSKRGIVRLKRLLLDFLSFPDLEVSWFVPAVLRASHIIRQKNIQCLITTAPPYSVQLIGLALKRLTGVRWIADYRDPWSLNHKYALIRNRATDAIESRLIRKAMESADVVISATPPMTERFRKEHPQLEPEKFVTITNGFDPDDFIGVAGGRSSTGPILFSYLGEFYDGRTPEPFLLSLKTLLDDRTLSPEDVRVRFVGNVAVAEGQSVPQMVRRLGLQDIVCVEHAIPRHQALQLTLQSHVLLVLTEQQSHALPFKFYEALGSGGIILNIGSGGAVAEVLAQTGRGIAVHHHNRTELRAGILECVKRAQSKQWESVPWEDPSIQHFNFRTLSGSLAGLLEDRHPGMIRTQPYC